MLSYLGLRSRHPEINVSQYTSPGRQMSLPETSDQDVTLPWMLSPKWYSTRPPGEVAGKRLKKPPKEALVELRNLYFSLQVEFFYPSLMFRDPEMGEPVFNNAYVEVLHYVKQLEGLLGELDLLRLPEEVEAQRTRLQGQIRQEIENVNKHVEEQREKAMRLEENIKAAQRKMEETQLTDEPVEKASWSQCIIS